MQEQGWEREAGAVAVQNLCPGYGHGRHTELTPSGEGPSPHKVDACARCVQQGRHRTDAGQPGFRARAGPARSADYTEGPVGLGRKPRCRHRHRARPAGDFWQAMFAGHLTRAPPRQPPGAESTCPGEGGVAAVERVPQSVSHGSTRKLGTGSTSCYSQGALLTEGERAALALPTAP